MRNKITVIGAGNVGASAAHCCLAGELGDVVMLDIAENIARGKALDLSQAAVLEGHGGVVSGTGDYRDTAESHVCIITAGMVRKPGMSRDDLLRANSAIVSQVVRDAVKESPEAFFIIVSNPVDVMCLVAMRAGGLPPHRVIGLSGVLDGARMCANIAAMARVPCSSVSGVVIGEHGNTMVPLPRLATIGGVPVPYFLTSDQMRLVCERTTSSGAEIVSLLGFSAYYAPGAAAAVMAEAVLRDSGALLCCSCHLEGQYGNSGIFMGVPATLGAKGVLNIKELALNDEEAAALAVSAAAVIVNAEVVKPYL